MSDPYLIGTCNSGDLLLLILLVTWYLVDREILALGERGSTFYLAGYSQSQVQDEKLKLIWGKLQPGPATNPPHIRFFEPHPLPGPRRGRQYLSFFFLPLRTRGIVIFDDKNRFCAHIPSYNLEKFACLTRLRKSPGPLFTFIPDRRFTCFAQRMSTMTSKENSPAVERPTKLEGRAFYESIGSPKFIVAPMVDQSEFVSRPKSCSNNVY